MDTLDQISINLIDEIVIIVKKLHLREDFIISLTPQERKHLLKIVKDILREEDNANKQIENNTRKMRATRSK